MADILSNDELDALLASVEGRSKPDAQAEQERKVSSYDFRRPSRLTRDHVHVLQPLSTAAAEDLSGKLSELLRGSAEVNAISIDALPYGHFISSLPAPMCLNICSLGEAEEKAVLTMDIPLALAMVDRLLGGAGVALEEIRPLTGLEQTIVDGPTRLITQCLSQHWQATVAVGLTFEERRMDPKMLQLAPASEVMLRIIFAVGGQIASGEMILAVPFSAIDRIMPREQIRERFYRAPREASEQERAALAARIREARVTLSAVLGHTELTLRDLIGLRVNDVLPLTRKVTTPVDVLVQGIPKLNARPGRVGRMLSIQITQAQG